MAVIYRTLLLAIYFVMFIRKDFCASERKFESSSIFRSANHHHPLNTRNVDQDSIQFPTLRKCEQMCNEYMQSACGHTRRQKRRILKSDIKAVEHASPMRYPHMALVGYRVEDKIIWSCGGSLVSNRYVLSAAHCASSYSLGPATHVRLGELVLDQTTDIASPTDLAIIDRIVHEQYKNTSVYHDIALFKLERDVIFSNYIRPICLYPRQNQDEVAILTATGWGQTGVGDPTSDSLQEVGFHIVLIERCAASYGTKPKFAQGLDAKTMLCADTSAGGEYTCTADSGEPLSIEIRSCRAMHYQIGIMSFGGGCADRNHPVVYTKVPSYLQWIEAIVWK